MISSLNVLPESFLNKLPTFIPLDILASVIQSFSVSKEVSFRVNTIKTTTAEVLSILDAEDILYKKVEWYPDAFIISQTDKARLFALPLYEQGMIYVQGLSSMIPAIVLDPHKDELVLDMAAAPGSKTTQLASLMGNEGDLTANDKSRARLYKLKSLLTQQGVTNTTVICASGEYLWKKLPEYFDKVLLDAPCSMEGRFFTDEIKSYEDWSPKKVKMLGQIQKYLLRGAISATKPGGTIVYSTCTLSPEENEEVLHWILEREKESVVLEEISLDISDRSPGLTHWKTKTFDPSIAKAMRVLPSKTMEGFFIAKFKKIKSNL